MGKKLTDKEKRAKEVTKVVAKIRRLEKQHSEDILKSACYKYSMAIQDRKRAEVDLKNAEDRVKEAKKRLR